MRARLSTWQAMYGVVHGGTDRALRAHSASTLGELPFDGYAIGGSLGRDRAAMLELLRYVAPLLPEEKPNHLLGVADPDSVRHGVECGIDTFDSCFPTRVARHGTLLTREGNLHIRKARYRSDFGAIDPSLPPTVDASRALMHHLCAMHEPLYETLASVHNLSFMHHLMAELRAKILADEL